MLYALAFVFNCFSQVGIGTTTPNPSSILDVSSTNQGFLPPRMTTAQRNAIVSPAEGLIVYNTDCRSLDFFNGTSWISGNNPVTTANSPSGLTASSFTLNWDNTGALSYSIDVSTSPTFATFLPGFSNLNVGSVISYNLTGLGSCATPYYYRVRANYLCGVSNNSNVMTVNLPCCISNYNVTSIPYAPIAGAGTSVTLADDQVSGSIPIGFTFNFYCNNYTNFFISSNGFITFNAASGSGCCSGQNIPNVADPNLLIAGGWDDLFPPGGGSITYLTTGVAPNRRLVVNYRNLPYCCGSTVDVNFQIILYETTNVIEVHGAFYNGISPGTIGVENIGGTIATAAPGRNAATWTSTNEAWRFN